MKRKITTLLLAFAMVIMMLPMTAVAVFAEEQTKPTGQWKDYAAESYAGGTGTEDDPYLIATEEQLAKLSVEVAGKPGASANNYLDNFFKLTNDLDLSAHRWNPIGQYKWETPNEENIYGNTTMNYFSGSFDGNGKTISGIYVDEKEDGFAGGLFGVVSLNSSASTSHKLKISDLTIEDAEIYGNGTGLASGYNGILALEIMGSGEKGRITVENVHVSGQIDIADADKVEYIDSGVNIGCYMVGAMGGNINYADFVNCGVSCVEIKGGVANSGGFVGISNSSTFTDCIVRGKTCGGWLIGGFVGYASEGASANYFTRCVADVDITANDWKVGGFCGYSGFGVFTDCAAFGNVNSEVENWIPYVAGFVGYVYNSSLKSCYFGGTVRSAHSDILPSAIAAVAAENYSITDCVYDVEKNPNTNAFSKDDATGGTLTAATSYTATALNTEAFINTVCIELYGNHQYEGNVCKICGLELVYINEDGYWVIDGYTTDIKAAGDKGEQGIQGDKGEKGDTGAAGAAGADGKDGLSVAATVIGSTAFVSNIALIVYAIIKKKKLF